MDYAVLLSENEEKDRKIKQLLMEKHFLKVQVRSFADRGGSSNSPEEVSAAAVAEPSAPN